ncbi:MAG: amidohydrolase family protein [Victivallaceae bacterium]|nr:amidohydrolase family protein [Victivallaceae bacterium]
MNEIIAVKNLFDGHSFHKDKILKINNGIIEMISPCEETNAPNIRSENFVMPALFESHCHLFLDGEELNTKKRSEYLKSDHDTMLNTALQNIKRYRENDITGVRDAGDIKLINLEVRDLVKESGFTVICPGQAIRKRKRYGSFMALEVDDAKSLVGTIKKLSKTGVDTIKIILTGIIDFEKGCVKDTPQFSLQELTEGVNAAHDLEKTVFVHCSGQDGLEIAVKAKVDSIEHGFFMKQSVLERMKEYNIAWCPTFMPVNFQMENPEYCAWNQESVNGLKRILDNHNKNLCLAETLGVLLLAGTDAGSYGVSHGIGLWQELKLMKKAGLSLEAVLRSATSIPRKQFNLKSNSIKIGNNANFIHLPQCPI